MVGLKKTYYPVSEETIGDVEICVTVNSSRGCSIDSPFAVNLTAIDGTAGTYIFTCVTPPTSFSVGLCMLLLLHALIPCVAAYILPLFLYTFWHCHPYILQHFNGNFIPYSAYISWFLNFANFESLTNYFSENFADMGSLLSSACVHKYLRALCNS